MAEATPAVTPAAPAAAAPAAGTPAAAAAAAPGAAATAAAATVVVADPVAVTAAETALATATAAAAGKPADSPEAKAAVTAKAALDALKPAAAAAKKAPENYEDFKLPQGVLIDKDVAGAVKAVAKEFDLSQADAQKLIDKVGPVLAKSEQTRFTSFVTERANGWRAASLKDAEIGGEKHAENMAVAMKTFDAFGTPALREVLNKTGIGDNPELLRWAYRVGKAIGPDNKIVSGTTLANTGTSPEDKLWPDKK